MLVSDEMVIRLVIPSQGCRYNTDSLEDPVTAPKVQIIALLFGNESSGQAFRRIKGRKEKELRTESFFLPSLEPRLPSGSSSWEQQRCAKRSPLGPSPGSCVFTLKDLVSCLVLVITLLNRDIKMNDGSWLFPCSRKEGQPG